jgi:parvulin-like peptidyl-prolyl isomerase
MMKRFFFASVAGTLAALPLAHAGSGISTTNSDSAVVAGDTVVVRGKGFEIRRREIDQVLATARAKNPDDVLPPDAELRVLTHLIEIRLVLQRATDTETAEGKRKTDANFPEIVKTLGEPEFERRLQATHMTADDLRLMLFQEETAQASLTRQLGIRVTDAEVKKYFDDNPGAFDEPERARIRELLLRTTVGYSSEPLPDAAIQARHKQIFELRQRVRAGEDFAALAGRYNEDFISKGTGGEVSFRADQMEYGDLAFSMKPKQISEVITNEDGYLFFQLLEKIPAKKAEFTAVADKLKKTLIGEQKRRLASAYIKQLWKEADVQIFDPALKAAMAANEAEAAEAVFNSRQAATNTPSAKP